MKRINKILGLQSILSILLLFSACTSAPDAHDIYGNPIFFSNFKGKWVYVNYWATWCKPCLEEMPALNDLYHQNKNKLIVLGINFDQLSDTNQKKFIKPYRIEYYLLRADPAEQLGISGTSVVPTTYVFNPKGKRIKTLMGPQTLQQLKQAMN